jgi:hypothetical protein
MTAKLTTAFTRNHEAEHMHKSCNAWGAFMTDPARGALDVCFESSSPILREKLRRVRQGPVGMWKSPFFAIGCWRNLFIETVNLRKLSPLEKWLLPCPDGLSSKLPVPL